MKGNGNSNMTLTTSNYFGTIKCDFYENDDGKYFFTRDQIGEALGYSNPQKAMDNLHKRHKDRLDKFSILLKLRSTDGKLYNTTLYSEMGVYEICRWSQKEKANEFLDWVWQLVNDYRHNPEMKPQISSSTVLELIQSLHTENRLIKKYLEETNVKLSRMEGFMRTMLPPSKHSQWKSLMANKIKSIAKDIGIDESEIKGVYGSIYNKMRNDYGLDVNNFTADYLLTHKDVANPPAIDVVEYYPELKELFESIVESYEEV